MNTSIAAMILGLLLRLVTPVVLVAGSSILWAKSRQWFAACMVAGSVMVLFVTLLYVTMHPLLLQGAPTSRFVVMSMWPAVLSQTGWLIFAAGFAGLAIKQARPPRPGTPAAR